MKIGIISGLIGLGFVMSMQAAHAGNCNHDYQQKQQSMSSHKQTADIVDTAVAAGSFKTLTKALQAAGLVDALRGSGPFTVFAPTDAAFAKIPAQTLNAILADKKQLQQILTYHVVPARLTANGVVSMNGAKTLAGQRLTFNASNGVKINNANVIKTDITTSNGIIHVIDSFLLPPSN